MSRLYYYFLKALHDQAKIIARLAQVKYSNIFLNSRLYTSTTHILNKRLKVGASSSVLKKVVRVCSVLWTRKGGSG